jgi:hypothetical protein
MSTTDKMIGYAEAARELINKLHTHFDVRGKDEIGEKLLSIQNQMDDVIASMLPQPPISKLNSVDVLFENPEYNYTTSVSQFITEEEARKYFVGTTFDVGSFPEENPQVCIDIRFKPS